MAVRWKDIPTTVRNRLRALVFERDGYQCKIQGPRCTGRAEDLDHIVPLELDGDPTDLNNLRAACRKCNRGRRIVSKKVIVTGDLHSDASREW